LALLSLYEHVRLCGLPGNGFWSVIDRSSIPALNRGRNLQRGVRLAPVADWADLALLFELHRWPYLCPVVTMADYVLTAWAIPARE